MIQSALVLVVTHTGLFNISQSGLIYTFKLVYRNGALRCSDDLPASYWGCTHNSYGDLTLITVIVYPNKTALPLAKYRGSKRGCEYYTYKIDGVGVNATELVFNNLPSPMTVSTGQEFISNLVWTRLNRLNREQ